MAIVQPTSPQRRAAVANDALCLAVQRPVWSGINPARQWSPQISPQRAEWRLRFRRICHQINRSPHPVNQSVSGPKAIKGQCLAFGCTFSSSNGRFLSLMRNGFGLWNKIAEVVLMRTTRLRSCRPSGCTQRDAFKMAKKYVDTWTPHLHVHLECLILKPWALLENMFSFLLLS